MINSNNKINTLVEITTSTFMVMVDGLMLLAQRSFAVSVLLFVELKIIRVALNIFMVIYIMAKLIIMLRKLRIQTTIFDFIYLFPF